MHIRLIFTFYNQKYILFRGICVFSEAVQILHMMNLAVLIFTFHLDYQMNKNTIA